MPKYYVKCGHIETLRDAESSEEAAFAALDRALQHHLWIYDDPDLSERDQRNHVVLEALMHLDPCVRISERGFGDRNALLLETPEVILRWHELMIGIQRLCVRAGLRSRAVIGRDHGRGSDAAQKEARTSRKPR